MIFAYPASNSCSIATTGLTDILLPEQSPCGFSLFHLISAVPFLLVFQDLQCITFLPQSWCLEWVRPLLSSVSVSSAHCSPSLLSQNCLKSPYIAIILFGVTNHSCSLLWSLEETPGDYCSQLESIFLPYASDSLVSSLQFPLSLFLSPVGKSKTNKTAKLLYLLSWFCLHLCPVF